VRSPQLSAGQAAIDLVQSEPDDQLVDDWWNCISRIAGSSHAFNWQSTKMRSWANRSPKKPSLETKSLQGIRGSMRSRCKKNVVVYATKICVRCTDCLNFAGPARIKRYTEWGLVRHATIELPYPDRHDSVQLMHWVTAALIRSS